MKVISFSWSNLLIWTILGLLVFWFIKERQTSFDHLLRLIYNGSKHKTILRLGYKRDSNGFIRKRNNNHYEKLQLGWKRMEYRTNDRNLSKRLIKEMDKIIRFDGSETYTTINNETNIFQSGITEYKSFIFPSSKIKVLFRPDGNNEDCLIIFIRPGN